VRGTQGTVKGISSPPFIKGGINTYPCKPLTPSTARRKSLAGYEQRRLFTSGFPRKLRIQKGATKGATVVSVVSGLDMRHMIYVLMSRPDPT
jgi:hypothetical protein